MKLAAKHFSGVEGCSKFTGILFGMGVDGNAQGWEKNQQDNGAA